MHDSFRRYIKRQRDKFLLFSKIMFRRKNASREVKLVCHIHLHLLIKQNRLLINGDGVHRKGGERSFRNNTMFYYI